MALNGLPLAAGDEVLASDQENWSLVSPLMVLRDRCGIKLIEVPIPVPLKDTESVVAAFRAAITKRTKVIVSYAAKIRSTIGGARDPARIDPTWPSFFITAIATVSIRCFGYVLVESASSSAAIANSKSSSCEILAVASVSTPAMRFVCSF